MSCWWWEIRIFPLFCLLFLHYILLHYSEHFLPAVRLLWQCSASIKWNNIIKVRLALWLVKHHAANTWGSACKAHLSFAVGGGHWSASHFVHFLQQNDNFMSTGQEVVLGPEPDWLPWRRESVGPAKDLIQIHWSYQISTDWTVVAVVEEKTNPTADYFV